VSRCGLAAVVVGGVGGGGRCLVGLNMSSPRPMCPGPYARYIYGIIYIDSYVYSETLQG